MLSLTLSNTIMYPVIVYSTLRNVSSTFATRHHMTTSPFCLFNKARRSFSSLKDAQDFAYNLLSYVNKEYRVVLFGDYVNGL